MTTLITVEQHEQQSRMDLAKHALSVLNKAYKGYIWGVRCEGPHNICITEQRLLAWGGDVFTMNIVDRDWNTINQFDAIVKRLGGELLERARLNTEKNTGMPCEQLPDGFHERFNKTNRLSKMKLVGPNGQTLDDMIRQREARFAREGLVKI